MKKLLFVTVITVVLGLANVNAQETKFGAKAGLNFAFITGDNAKNYDITSDFYFGAMAEIKISDKFFLQPELLYSVQGYNTNIDSEGFIALNYLSIPLLAKYYITEKLSLEAGPQIGFLLSTKGGTKDYKDLFKTTDFGVNFGISYKLNNGLNFSARYNLGLTNINNIDGVPDKNRNRVFQLSISYFFF
jgi:hypothetical protein